MTLEEAIKHCEEVAEQNETRVQSIEQQLVGSAIADYLNDCLQCAADHRQLAEWLRELKNYQTAIADFERRTMSQCLTKDYCDGWNNCYDDIMSKLNRETRGKSAKIDRKELIEYLYDFGVRADIKIEELADDICGMVKEE